MMPAMIAYSAVHREFGEAWRHRVMEPSRVCLKKILRRGINRSLLPATLDMDIAMALLLGPYFTDTSFTKKLTLKTRLRREAAESFFRAYAVAVAPMPAPDKAKRARTKRSSKAKPANLKKST